MACYRDSFTLLFFLYFYYKLNINNNTHLFGFILISTFIVHTNYYKLNINKETNKLMHIYSDSYLLAHLLHIQIECSKQIVFFLHVTQKYCDFLSKLRGQISQSFLFGASSGSACILVRLCPRISLGSLIFCCRLS
jgi:hypothetical protein